MNEQTVLFDLLKEGVSPAHVVKSCEKRLRMPDLKDSL